VAAEAKAAGRTTAGIGFLREVSLVLDEPQFLREFTIVHVKGSTQTVQTVTADDIVTWRLLHVEDTLFEGKTPRGGSVCSQFSWTGQAVDKKTLAFAVRGGSTVIDGVTITADFPETRLVLDDSSDYLLFGELCAGRMFRLGYDGAEAFRILPDGTIGPSVLPYVEPMNSYIRGFRTPAALKQFLAK
jgi:hypothetical protein